MWLNEIGMRTKGSTQCMMLYDATKPNAGENRKAFVSPLLRQTCMLRSTFVVRHAATGCCCLSCHMCTGLLLVFSARLNFCPFRFCQSINMPSSNGKRSLDTSSTSNNDTDTDCRATKTICTEGVYLLPKSEWVFQTPVGRRTRALPTPAYDKNGKLLSSPFQSTTSSSEVSSSSSSVSDTAIESAKKKLDQYMRDLLASEPSSSD